MRRPGKNHALVHMIGRCIPVDARVRLRRCIRRLGVVWRDIRDHVVQVDSLIHLEAAVQNYVGELDGAQDHADRIALTIETQDTANGAARRKDNLAHLKVADLRRIGVKRPGKAVRRDGLDGLVSVLHEDDARLVIDRGIPTRSDSKFDLRRRQRVRIDGVNDGRLRMQFRIEEILRDACAPSGVGASRRGLRLLFARWCGRHACMRQATSGVRAIRATHAGRLHVPAASVESAGQERSLETGLLCGDSTNDRQFEGLSLRRAVHEKSPQAETANHQQ